MKLTYTTNNEVIYYREKINEVTSKEIFAYMDAACRARVVASRELEEAIRQANRYLKSINPTPRLLQQRIARVNEREQRLRQCHYVYCEKAKISIDEEERVTYLSEKTDAAIDYTDKCTICIDDIEGEHQISIDTATEEKRNLEKETFREQLKSEVAVEEKFALELMIKLNEIVNMEITDEVILLAKTYDEKLCESVDNLTKSGKSLIRIYDSVEELEQLTNDKSGKRVQFQEAHSRASVVIENHYANRERANITIETLEESGENITQDVTQMSNNMNAANMVRPEK